MSIRWELLELVDEQPRSHRSRLTITNDGDSMADLNGWTLYFNAPQPIESGAEHFAGNLYRWTAPKGTTLAPHESRDIELRGLRWPMRITDAPSGFYSTTEERPRVIDKVEILLPAERLRVDSMDNWLPSAATRFAANERLLPADERPGDAAPVLPTPVEITLRQDREPFRVNAFTVIRHDGDLATEAEYLAQTLGALLTRGEPLRTAEDSSEPQDLGRAIALRLASAESKTPEEAEGYLLSVLPTGVEIASRTPAGVFYGIQSLRALIAPTDHRGDVDALLVPSAHVRDWPRFGYRGLMLDVSRNFQSNETVEKLLELMSFYKLNRLHFHLTDDEGWRFEVQDLPELTSVGARRGHTLDESTHLIPSFGSGPNPDQAPGTGHYSRDQLVELLKFAHRRHIEVIPEIDVPGHARAAIRAMEARRTRLLKEGNEDAAAAYLLSDPQDTSEYMSVQNWDDNVVNVCQESSYRFLQKVFDELAAIYRQAQARLTTIHIGGDEVPVGVWAQSPACQSLMSNDGKAPRTTGELSGYFFKRVHTMLDDMGLTTAGWEEIGLERDDEEPEGRKRPNLELAGKGIRVHSWNDVWGWGGEDNAYKLAGAGYQVVLSNASSLYFDLAANADPDEPGFYWAGLVDAERVWSFVPFNILRSDTLDRYGRAIDKSEPAEPLSELDESAEANVLGIQGQIWGETTIRQERLEYMVFPKLLALAERAWAEQPSWASWARSADDETRLSVKETAWSEFATRLGHRELPRLDFLEGGVNYRIPVPGGRVIRGALHANIAFPGLTLRYSLDGTPPDSQAPVYDGSVALEPPASVVLVRAFDRRGRASRSAVVEASMWNSNHGKPSN